jgi:hypothetical protein
MALVSKTKGVARLPWVQIPPPPPMGTGNKRIVWMDEFNVDSCCQRDNLENCVKSNDWIPTFFSVSSADRVSTGTTCVPLRCKTCGRFWFKVAKGRWTVKAKK